LTQESLSQVKQLSDVSGRDLMRVGEMLKGGQRSDYLGFLRGFGSKMSAL